MVLPLMPKATAVWLIENTMLSFEQIAEFCGMHPLEVQGIADGEVAIGIVGKNPVESGQLSHEQIAECEKNPDARLSLADHARKYISNKVKGSRYTPVARRQDKPDAISWLLKHHPELSDANLVRLVGTTKSTIEAIRSRTHWNSQNIKPKDPVMLGLCTQIDLEATIARAKRTAEAGAISKTKKKRTASKKKAVKRTAASIKSPTTSRKEATVKTSTSKPKAKPAAKKAAPKKAAAKKPAAKKAAVKKPAAKKPAVKKTVAKKPAAKKTTAKKPAAKKAVAKKPMVKKAVKRVAKKKK